MFPKPEDKAAQLFDAAEPQAIEISSLELLLMMDEEPSVVIEFPKARQIRTSA